MASRCSDECTLGDKNGSKTCAPFDITTGKAAASDPATSTHDRARGYLARLRTESLASGGVGSATYADATLTTIEAMQGIGDSALWTGTLLASEALRLRATGAADARARVRSLTQTMHLWLNVARRAGHARPLGEGVGDDAPVRHRRFSTAGSNASTAGSTTPERSTTSSGTSVAISTRA